MGLPAGPNVLSPTKALPLFLSLNVTEIVQIRTVSLGMQEELLAQQTKHQ